MTKRFDVVRVRRKLTVVLQSEIHDLDTVLVAPLERESDLYQPMRGLHLPLEFGGERLLLIVPGMGAVDHRLLSEPIGNVAYMRDRITRSVDLLMQGF